MADTTHRKKLFSLGYTELWLESGVLTKEILEEQIQSFNSGEDSNTEHYRYRTLINYFDSRISFDDDALKQLLLILQTDGDKAMAGSATVYLLRKSSLTDTQFDTVADFLKIFGDWTTKQVNRARQFRLKP